MDLLEKIIKAKETLGDEVALRIADYLHIEKFDEHSLKGCCPFHKEDTPSFIWNKKDKSYKCFSCSRTYGIVDMYTETEGSYQSALKRLFKETGIEDKFSLGNNNEDYFANYRFPKEETNTDRDRVEAYCHRRGISKATLDYAGIKQDHHGNVVFELRDFDNRLLAVKYRQSRAVPKGQAKMWWQQNADTCPSLFNLQNIDITQPLLITEGPFDLLSVLEAGYRNVVSIPGGANDLNWLEFNWEILEQIPEFILWFDNDRAGDAGRTQVQQRLGEYRCKIVKPIQDDAKAVRAFYEPYGATIEKTDANNILVSCGKQRILDLISQAEEIPSKKLKYLMDCEPTSIKDLEKFSFGIKKMDDLLYGNLMGCFTIYSGKPGCVDCDTEYFNGTEWKRIADYIDGEKILVYNKFGKATLEIPEQYHKYKCDTLYHFETKYGLNQTLSPEHNIYYITSKGNLYHKTFEEVIDNHTKTVNGFQGRFITTFKYSGKGIDLTDSEIELMCATICDGCFPTNTTWCRFNLKKDRKKAKLKEILEKCNIEYKEKVYTTGNRVGYSKILAYVPRHEKEFGDYWYNCNQHQLQVICDNILFWDGHEQIRPSGTITKSFSTSNKKTADFIQFAFTSCGYRTTIRIDDRVGQIYKTNGKFYSRKSIYYELKITHKNLIGMTNSNNNGSDKCKIIPCKTIDGYKYCFTTSTGMWIMRRKNCICVTGNSGKTSLADICTIISSAENNMKSFIFSGELGSSQLSDWIVQPLAGPSHVIESSSSSEKMYYTTTKQALKEIKQFYRPKLLVYNDTDALETSGDSIMNAMEEAYRRNGCRTFLIDNLMCVSFDGIDSDNRWDSQKKFIVKLMNFTTKYNVSTNLVVHPRKMNNGSEVTTDSLHGASEIANLCHRLIWCTRLNEEEGGYNLRLDIIKDRPSQMAGTKCELYFDSKTRRIYSDLDELKRKYSWEIGCKIQYSPEEDGKLVYHQLPTSLPHEQVTYEPF